MVSLSNHETFEASTADSVSFMYKDATPLVNPCSAPDLEPPFRIVATSGVIIFQALSLVVLVVLSFVLPSIVDSSGPGDAYSVLLYTHCCLWAAMMLIDCYLHRQHSILHCCGYISFYQLTKRLRRANVYIMSAGSTMFVLLAVLVDNYCHDRGACPGSPLKPIHYMQILLTLEALVAFPFLLKYLVMTVNFHKNKYRLDVQHDELLLSFMHSQSSVGDLGFRDDTYLEDIVEKQSDMIRYLKKYNAFLGRKILNLSVELNNFRSHTSC
uniref:Transmembrane protein 192 n=1 Tax=Amblyomma triste TaxID=251400 RepID=A0A023GJT7_AMBTT